MITVNTISKKIDAAPGISQGAINLSKSMSEFLVLQLLSWRVYIFSSNKIEYNFQHSQRAIYQ
jgi:hypothetical protein